jgi:hypothetical protein
VTIKTNTIYKSDRGEKFDVTKMQDSHIINVLRLKRDQIYTLEAAPNLDSPNIKANLSRLKSDMDVLFDELAGRVPKEPPARPSIEGPYEDESLEEAPTTRVRTVIVRK